MLVLVITGSSCVGKTTAANLVLERAKCRSAFLDSEWAACYAPLNSLNRPTIMIENMCACAKNYSRAGVHLFILTFAHIEHVIDLKSRLVEFGFDVWVASLVADESILKERYERTGGSRMDPYLQVISKLNNENLKSECDFRVDTSTLSAAGVCDAILSSMKGLETS